MEEAPAGRAISSGFRLDDLTPRELCDLVFFWIVEGKDEGQAMRDRGKFEVPPKGYRGSLVGTSWDTAAMNADYFRQAGTQIKAGEVT